MKIEVVYLILVNKAKLSEKNSIRLAKNNGIT